MKDDIKAPRASVRRVDATATVKSGGKQEFLDKLEESEIKPAVPSISLSDLGATEAGTVLVYNASGTEFHVPPTTFRPSEMDPADIIIFEVGEIRAFDEAEVKTKQFKQCLIKGKLRLVGEDEANKINKDKSKALKKVRTSSTPSGLNDSGLPNNTKAALTYIFDCEDIEELEAFADREDRDLISDAIEQRIEELEQEENN